MDGSLDVLIKEEKILFWGFEPETEKNDGATDQIGKKEERLNSFPFFVFMASSSSHLDSEGHVLNQWFTNLSAH